ncbi:transposase [Trinickia caryophylli]|nr:transposase [Trinickia caryophylli]WQE13450.1 transposase [Trinickia caryophylli]GLU34026.1 hypothetical protein Busp01_38680 [Trinickia caryophylli]
MPSSACVNTDAICSSAKLGSKNYPKEFRAMVVAQSNDPARSIADVAQEHGLNANTVARWHRAHERAKSTTNAQPAEGRYRTDS